MTMQQNWQGFCKRISGCNSQLSRLESSPWHEIAKKQFKDRFGGILTIRTGSKKRAFEIINALKLPLIISNIGDTKTLVIHPESTLNVHSTPEEKETPEYLMI